MSKPTSIPRCARCAERLAPGAPSAGAPGLCERCAARRASPGSHPVFPPALAAYDPERRNSPIYHFMFGVRSFLGAVPYALRTRGIKRYVALPILVTLALLVAVVLGSIVLVAKVLGPAANQGAVSQFGHVLAATVVVVAVLVLGYVLFFPLARIALAPFAEKISERVEALALGERAEQTADGEGRDVVGVARSAIESVLDAVKMVLLQACVTLPLLLIPVAGPVLLVVAGVFFNGIGALDMAMGRKRLRFGERLRFAWRHLSLVLGLGTAVYVVLLVPFVDLLAIPLGAIGGTHVFLRSWEADAGGE